MWRVFQSVAMSGFPSKIERSKDSRIAMDLLSLLLTIFLLHFQRSFFPKASTLVGFIFGSERMGASKKRRANGREGEREEKKHHPPFLLLSYVYLVPFLFLVQRSNNRI